METITLIKRIASFDAFKHPENFKYSILQLARLGFCYNRTRGQIVCSSCTFVPDLSTDLAIISSEHRKFSSACLYCVGDVVPTVDYKENAMQTCITVSEIQQQAKHPGLSSREERLRTFRGQEHKYSKSKFPEIIDRLVEAGLYYLGPTDNVRCFFCNGGLKNWNKDDEPFQEHKKWFPDCKFVKYVDQFRGTQEHLTRNVEFYAPIKVLESRELKARLELPICAKLQEMGYQKDHIRQAIEFRFATYGDDHTSVEELIKDILRIQGDAALPRRDSTISPKLQARVPEAQRNLEFYMYALRKVLESREVKARLELPICAKLQEIGFQKDHVRQAIELRFATYGDYHTSVEELIKDILRIQGDAALPRKDSESSSTFIERALDARKMNSRAKTSLFDRLMSHVYSPTVRYSSLFKTIFTCIMLLRAATTPCHSLSYSPGHINEVCWLDIQCEALEDREMYSRLETSIVQSLICLRCGREYLPGANGIRFLTHGDEFYAPHAVIHEILDEEEAKPEVPGHHQTEFSTSSNQSPILQRAGRVLEAREVTARLDTSMFQKLMSQGFQREHLKKAIERRFMTTGDDFESAHELIKDILEVEGEKALPLIALPTTSDKGPDIFNIDQPVSQEVLNMTACDVEGVLENRSIDDEDLRNLWEEYKELKQVRTCTICLDREINTVFLPCGHYATCEECASKTENLTCCVRRCPIKKRLTNSGGCYIVKSSREISPLIEDEPRQSDVGLLVAHLVTAVQVSANVD